MKVIILRSTQADGGKSFDRGDTPDLPIIDAQILIADGAAVKFVEPAAKAPAAIETADAPPAAETAARRPSRKPAPASAA
jgi:hypothetical protein